MDFDFEVVFIWEGHIKGTYLLLKIDFTMLFALARHTYNLGAVVGTIRIKFT